MNILAKTRKESNQEMVNAGTMYFSSVVYTSTLEGEKSIEDQ
jgi:hypothetical protein